MWFISTKVQGFTRLQCEVIQKVNSETADISWISKVQLEEE
jgi:hypothetical protein